MADEDRLEKAVLLSAQGKKAEAADLFVSIIKAPTDGDDVDGIRVKESAIYKLGEIYASEKRSDDLKALLLLVRPFFTIIPKAKTAKVVRKIFGFVVSSGAPLETQEEICLSMIEWSKEEKRTFLRHRLQHRLGYIYYEQNEPLKALPTINQLLKEVRRLEDRSLLVEIHLLESKVYHSIKNSSKSRAALVAARTNATAIYCPPLSQAEIDMQSGVLHAEEKDAKTAFSYLYEAFEGYHTLGGEHTKDARKALKYTLLAKIMSSPGEDLNAILTSKNVMQYAGRDIDAMKAVAEAYAKKDTHSFNKILAQYEDVLQQDYVVAFHLKDMYNLLLEQHMMRIIEPFSRVEIARLASILQLDEGLVESRISQMILDKKLNAIIDQQHRCVVVYDEDKPSTLYTDALDTIDNLSKVADAMFDKIAGKFDHLSAEAEKKKADEEKKEKEAKKQREEQEAKDKEKKEQDAKLKKDANK